MLSEYKVQEEIINIAQAPMDPGVKFSNLSHDQVGELSWKDGKFEFKGNAEESAKLFFNWLKPLMEEYMKELKNGR